MGSTTFEELKEKALSLPLKPGVYLMMDQAGTVIYVGKAKALKNRVSQYFHDPSNHNEKTRAMVAQIDHFDTIVAGSEFEALVLENSLIKRHKPHYNILLKDDKGYPYIRLSVKELYPRFSIQGKLADDGAKYFGPFGGRHDTQAILDAIRGALKLPTCGKKFPRDQGKERPCLNFHMGLCDGYCRKEMPRSQHQEAMAQAIRLLEGKFGQVEKDLREQMEEAAEALEFERAAALRDRLKAITLLGKRQKVVAGFLADTDVLGLYTGQVRSGVAVLHFQGGELAGRDLEVFPTGGEPAEEILSAFLTQFYGARGLLPKQILLPENLEEAPHISRLLSHQAGRKVELVTPQRGAKADLIRMAQENARTECERMTTKAERTASVLRLLAEKLSLPEPPGRIEAYDISNTGASDIVAAMTVFEDGKPKKSAYRYFLLRDLDGPDDYASMDQVISRRFKREIDGDERFARHPDLLLIDGGQTHAAVARRAMERYGLDIPTFGMVKDDRHRTRALVTPEGREIGIQGAPALFAFIGQIQEETHRFAIEFNRLQRKNRVQGSVLDRALSVRENLASRAALYGIQGGAFRARLAELAQLLDFADLLNRPVGKLSGGQRRRIDIARALLHEPEILILDEPTTGLDPQTRLLLWSVVMQLRAEHGLTVFLTTHYMEEAADADYVVILDSGSIAAEGTPLELKNRFTGDFVTLYGITPEKAASLGEYRVESTRDGIRIAVKNTAEATQLILKHPELFIDYEIKKGGMDDVFLAATGKKLSGGVES